MSINEAKFYSVDQVATLLGVHRLTITRQIQRGNLGCYYVGDRILISHQQLEEFLARSERKARRKREVLEVVEAN